MKHGRPAVELVETSKRFLLNGEDPTDMFRHFGKGYPLGEDTFFGLSVRDTGFGQLIESRIAHLGCKVKGRVASGDHNLYVGQVVDGGVVEGPKPYTHLRMNGLSY